MDNNVLWSLRLGFSARQAEAIKSGGIKHFLEQSFASKADTSMPALLSEVPKTMAELSKTEKTLATRDAAKAYQREQNAVQTELKGWWIDKMKEAEFPLREKMVVFWHNHFVSAISVNYWVFQHNTILRQNAFGNFRELTKKIITSNAMVKYLNNNQNRKGKYNENLSRELLELFTVGIGNYSEADIKNGAKGLAGLTMGDNGASYKSEWENNEPFTYLGKTGNFKANEIVDIIFEQKNAPYHITRKILKWFIYDNPPEELVKHYGDYLRAQDYEIKPFLQKIFTEEFDKPTAGSKIKDPLLYILQLDDELNAKLEGKLVAIFLAVQGMNLFNQVNVKGWDGGRLWLGSQAYLQRNNVADLLCGGKNIRAAFPENRKNIGAYREKHDVHLNWTHKGNNKAIIAELSNRLLFRTDSDMQKTFEEILKHDFDPQSKGADTWVMTLFNTMVKRPEFQLI